MFGYVCFYNGKQADIFADSAYEAQQKAAAHFKLKAKDGHKISVFLAQREDGTQVTHSTASI